jgi:hypothetical protein
MRRTWEMNVHLITIEIGIVGITALSALWIQLTKGRNVPISVMHPNRLFTL